MMQYGIWPKIYSCNNCSTEMKKNRGCKKPKRNKLLEIECVCGGNKHCELCKGENKFTLKECPAKMNNKSVNRFLPFFWHYKQTQQYPDGRGRLFQPSKLLEAISLSASLSGRQEQKEMEKARNNNG